MNPPPTDWLASLTLPSHATLLRRLVAEAEGRPAFRFIELCCSIARGTGDELSDLDLGLGVADDAWPDALSTVAPLLTDIGELVDLLEHRIAAWGDLPHRRFFVQYRGGVQVDLVAMPVSQRTGMPPGNIALYDPDRTLETTMTSSLERATPETVREWAFLGWIALDNLDKYVRRGSSWEALEQLHEARTHLWRLWAVTCGAPYPAFGLTSALDQLRVATPIGLEDTVATLELHDLRRAASALASLLMQISARAADAVGAHLPLAMGTYISERLAEGDAASQDDPTASP
ncbi:MAG: hypothetical protein M3406_09760 [Chloroflexota bacterium]|nr:hypothetical protein [Chloroflexota bacterium]